MAGTALDTSVAVAALLSWHEHHSIVLPLLQAALKEEGGPVLPLPALIETYSVLTRLPPPSRLAPADALELLARTFRGRCRIVALDGQEGWSLLETLARRGIVGGTTRDAHIVACARKAGAGRLVTLNRRDLSRLELGGIELVVPAWSE